MHDEDFSEEDQAMNEDANDEDEEGEATQQEDDQYERELAKSIKKQVQSKEEDYDTWFVCDGC